MQGKHKVRVQLYMPEELVADIDAYARQMGISRSNAIVFWCSQQVVANKMVSVFDEIIDTCKRITPVYEKNPELVAQLSNLIGVSELYKSALSEQKNEKKN